MTSLDSVFDGLDGSFALWLGRPDRPAATLNPDTPHYPASTMKIGVMAAAFRLADSGRLDLDAEIPVHNAFTSAVGGTFAMDPDYDSDPQVWERLGGKAPLRWLIRRMIVRSSNLGTNLVLEQVGYDAAQRAYTAVGATNSFTKRGIEDYAAAESGVDNRVTAAALAAQLSAIQTDRMASPSACSEMIDILAAQELNTDFARGVPEGTKVALKNGWIEGVRHSAAIVYPTDAEPYVLTACASSPLAMSQDGDDEVCAAFARLSELAWRRRRELP
ncbi:MAG TPA: serine hydrolase [Stackebrandtia sp.]|jgi:beta-lactamase class A|uniref:serine hydrolase n=1 Tax=Stackebrandtia sp. TaxID=2023065 RepID=UPI002D656052|nr:serine hydrolase [Stackebrandtia sp.]HZE41410.1 serine hydrolase [Stackebrandtia sp.]